MIVHCIVRVPVRAYLYLMFAPPPPSPPQPNLLPDLATAFHQAMLMPGLQLYKMAALARLFTALCRLLGDGDRLLFLSFDLIRKPLTAKDFPVLSGMASVWPTPLSRRGGCKLFEKNKLQLQGLCVRVCVCVCVCVLKP